MFFLIFSLAITLGAQQTSNSNKTPAAAKPAGKAAPATAPAKPQGITVDSVVEMTQAGLSEDLIIASLRKGNKAFDLSPTDLIRLKKANVTDNVLQVMLDPKAELKVPPTAQSVAIPVQPTFPTAIVAQSPLYNPSGATPAAGVNASGDLNDPMTPHESGIYLFTKDRDGNSKMTVLERAQAQGVKTGGGLCTALT